MIRSSDDLPAPLAPSTPILAPWKNDSQIPRRISRLGGTTLRRSFITYAYSPAISPLGGGLRRLSERGGYAPSDSPADGRHAPDGAFLPASPQIRIARANPALGFAHCTQVDRSTLTMLRTAPSMAGAQG